MIKTLKAKIKKILLILSGRFNHLKIGVKINKKWYGNRYGGFFLFPESLNEKSIVYSFGIGEDISFDEAVIKNHNSFVFGFDPTPKSINWIKSQQNALPDKFSFFEYGISDESGFINFYLPKAAHHISGSLIKQSNVNQNKTVQVEMKSIVDISQQLGHKKIDVLKMDIEGAEYKVIENILKSAIQIDQILIEFHERFFDDGQAKTTNIVNIMKQNGYEIFGISDSFDEISFIKKHALLP